MKITSPWRRNNNADKKKPVTSKPKIAWDQLGRKNRNAADTSMSIEEIRRQVIQASNQALGQGVDTDPRVDGARSSGGGKQRRAQLKATSRGNARRDRVRTSARRAKR